MKLEYLKPNASVLGIVPNQAVKIISVEPIGNDTVNLVYRDAANKLDERMLLRQDEANIKVAPEQIWSFNGDGADFRLATEAYRIKLAHLFDPLMAVHTSHVKPLPHQIMAVYESMLPRQPLRFLLADDPGAGKTIMAGLLIRELMLRGDVKRCLIIAPGALVEQWQDELDQKFGLKFDIITGDMVEASRTGNPFEDVRRSLLICRLDQISRQDTWQTKLLQTEWDLIVVDEAHKMSASFFGNKVDKTKRYKLGEKLDQITRHLLLMTATPHNGKEADFQLFLALLDPDRFSFHKFRENVHKINLSDIMRRMIKEDLLTFENKPLFPERRAYTVNYQLSKQEMALYNAVTDYVREEMNRAEKLDKKRQGNVGFALTVLQRRLASSPEAIYQSLARRYQRLEKEKRRLKAQSFESINQIISDDDMDDLPSSELEATEDELVERSTAARKIPELEAEISSLKALKQQAAKVKRSPQDKKWEELSRLLQEQSEMYDATGLRRKLIIFTEHRDTVNYLYQRIKDLLGLDNAVAVIHGNVKREERRKIQERFTQDKDLIVLLATDAAGEGVNLQRANLMINYDLPWNPNRIEQRFGRIHRIGQTEVCHLWNLVAENTREGDVFQRLFDKLNIVQGTLGGRVFDILGEVFSNHSLKDLLIEAIRYGEQPKVKAKLHNKVENALNIAHLREIIARAALATEMGIDKLFAVKEDMEKAQARQLQPHFIKAFFMEALARYDGKTYKRESERYEITYVPTAIRGRNTNQPVLKKYQRICFEKDKIQQQGKPLAALICPGHPLMDALVDLTLDQYRPLLKEGTVLIDPTDEDTEPRILWMIDYSIRDGSEQQRLISRHLQFVHLYKSGKITLGGDAPYLDYRPAHQDELSLIQTYLDDAWLQQDLESKALEYATQTLVQEHFQEIKIRQERMIKMTLQAVHERLVKEINYWTRRAAELQQKVSKGKQPRVQPENAKRRAEELRERLRKRTEELEAQQNIISNTPQIIGGALIIPQACLKNQATVDVAARQRVEQLAMQAVMDYEISLGYTPEDVSAQNLGWDITSQMGEGELRFIEVKGRVKGATTVTVTKNEILTGFNQPDKFILAIVLIDGDKAEKPYYIRQPFKREPEFGVTSVNYSISELIK